MGAFSTVNDLTGFFYEIYDKIVDPIPESAKFMAKVGYKGGALEIGNKLHINVIVSDEGGFTYAARGAGAFAVNDGVAFQTQDAQVDAFQLLLQGSVDYESAARASSSRKAFLELVGKKLQVMVASTKRRYESELLYGQSATKLGTVSGAPAGSTVTIAAQEWAPMLWQGKKGQMIDFYAPGVGGALRTGGKYTIVSVNFVTRVITLDKAVNAAVLAGDVITWFGSYGNTTAEANALTCAGAFRIASNTGVMFNIDAAQYDVWAGNSIDVGAKKLTLGIVMQGMAKLANRGLESDVDVWVSPATWATMITDQAALRRYQAETKKWQNGAKSLTFAHQSGDCNIFGHGMIKEGYALVTETRKWKRVGAQDFSFKTPGLEEGRDIFWHDPAKAGFSYRYYGAQSLFCEMPSHQLVFSNIDNNSAT